MMYILITLAIIFIIFAIWYIFKESYVITSDNLGTTNTKTQSNINVPDGFKQFMRNFTLYSNGNKIGTMNIITDYEGTMRTAMESYDETTGEKTSLGNAAIINIIEKNNNFIAILGNNEIYTFITSSPPTLKVTSSNGNNTTYTLI